MSREKFSMPWIAAACPPVINALAASGRLLRPAAMAPTIIAAMPISDCRDSLTMPRAMCRWVTCDSSCASTEASSSRLPVTAINPRCTPT